MNKNTKLIIGAVVLIFCMVVIPVIVSCITASSMCAFVLSAVAEDLLASSASEITKCVWGLA